MMSDYSLLDEAVIVATKLLGARPSMVEAVAAGANSRIYRVEYSGRTYALKRYPVMSVDDPRDRQGCEQRALALMLEWGITTVPRVVALEQSMGFSLLEWVDGQLVTDVADRDAAQACHFLGQVANIPHNPQTRLFPLASEACLSGREILRQVSVRRERLESVLPDEPVLKAFYDNTLRYLLDDCIAEMQRLAQKYNIDIDHVLDEADRCLIPADFGFHNAMRLSDGSLRFIDFEYFGWDDPVKLSVDFLVHPSVHLSSQQKKIIHDGLLKVYGTTADFEARLEAWQPALVARWALIMLNVFLPKYQQARSHLQTSDDVCAMKVQQVLKVSHFLQVHAAAYAVSGDHNKEPA